MRQSLAKATVHM